MQPAFTSYIRRPFSPFAHSSSECEMRMRTRIREEMKERRKEREKRKKEEKR
jgi:hypothetical protein